MTPFFPCSIRAAIKEYFLRATNCDDEGRGEAGVVSILYTSI